MSLKLNSFTVNHVLAYYTLGYNSMLNWVESPCNFIILLSFFQLPIKSIHWSRVNPCNIHILLLDGCIKTFELIYSDIYTSHSSDKTALDCAVGEHSLVRNYFTFMYLCFADYLSNFIEFGSVGNRLLL